MNVLPVITRELRAQARQRFTFTLRVLGVGIMLGAAGLFAFQDAFVPNLGAVMFQYLHLTLFFAIWILVPLSTADCISRERREGTLGLLFLTPLKAADIVMAKSIAHGLRAGTLLVAILPVFTIPFLMGGVSWQHATISATINCSALSWSLAASLLASAGPRSALRATVGAIVFSLCGLLALVFTSGSLAVLGAATSRVTIANFASHIDEVFLVGIMLLGFGSARLTGGAMPVLPRSFLASMTATAMVSLLALLVAIGLASWQIRRTWREEPPPRWVQWWTKTFCTPVLWLKFFKRWMRWKIEHNPIGWLEQRTWTGRLVTWAWFAIVISVYSAVLTDRNFFRNFGGLQITMAWLMMGSIAASAAGSFRRERESGVLELLLVAPLTTQQIIGGRLRGLWGQFLPAVGALLGIWLYFQSLFHSNADTPQVCYFAATFLVLPVVGLYFSLSCRHFIAAFVFTLVTGLFLAPALERMLAFLWWAYTNSNLPFDLQFETGFGTALVQLFLVTPFLVALQRLLKNRSFPTDRMAQ